MCTWTRSEYLHKNKRLVPSRTTVSLQLQSTNVITRWTNKATYRVKGCYHKFCDFAPVMMHKMRDLRMEASVSVLGSCSCPPFGTWARSCLDCTRCSCSLTSTWTATEYWPALTASWHMTCMHMPNMTR
jgi:hypothetical protein